MGVFKKTKDILENVWPNDNNYHQHELPRKYEWLKETPMTFDDVDIWEQIYSEPGNIGIYAAWSPYREIYIIVHNQFLHESFGIEIYQGPTASDQVYKRASQFNIKLPQNAVWI